MSPPLNIGQIVRVKRNVPMIVGAPDTPPNTMDRNILLPEGAIVCVVAIEHEGKNPHARWWRVFVLHSDKDEGSRFWWRIMTEDDIAQTFENVLK